jgi:hypothetical protein
MFNDVNDAPICVYLNIDKYNKKNIVQIWLVILANVDFWNELASDPDPLFRSGSRRKFNADPYGSGS